MSISYNVIHTPLGILWKGNDLSGMDGGLSMMKDFIEKNPHADWSLSIFDSLTQSTIEINCSMSEMPEIVSYIWNLEHASPMNFIGENYMTESYIVGMPCTRGRLNIPGVYKAENGKLIAVK